MELSSSQVQGAICLLDPDNKKPSLWSTAAGISLADQSQGLCVQQDLWHWVLACLNIIRAFRAGKVSFSWGEKIKNAQGFVPHSWKQESVGGNREGGFGSGSGSEGVVRFQSCQVSKLNSHVPTTWMWAKVVLRWKGAEEGERGQISITPLSPEENGSGYCCILWPVFSLSFYLLTACQK